VICTKVRDGDKRIVRLKEGEPRHRHVVIVDDLVQSGGTLIECQKLLASQVLRCSSKGCDIAMRKLQMCGLRAGFSAELFTLALALGAGQV
jgi:adenine/guanine phosphoribosyltransferase-like PRPP-binding protein